MIRRSEVALDRKYGWPKWLLDLGSRLTGRIRRRAWIAIDVEPRSASWFVREHA